MKPNYKLLAFLCWCLIMSFSHDCYPQEKNVGIGTTTPEGELHVTKLFTWAGTNFAGTGLNDLSVDYESYSGFDRKVYIVVVSNAGPDPNLFKWSDDNGGTWTDFVQMSTTPTPLSYGLSISFVSTSGHTFGDQWTWVMDVDFPDGLVVKNGDVGIGTTTPQARLEVMGSILYSGELLKNGSGIRLNDLADAKAYPIGSCLFVGEGAGFTWQPGYGANQNTGIGVSALQNLDLGIINTAIGYSTLSSTEMGSFNVAVGGNALQQNTTGNENTTIGSNSMIANMVGNTNCGLGIDVLHSNVLGSKNIAIGGRALYNNYIQDGLIAIGDSALFTNGLGAVPYTSEAFGNIAIGQNALKSNSSGSYNTSIGSTSMERNTSGNENTAVGNRALKSNLQGNANCAFGSDALHLNSLGRHNIAIGRRALYNTYDRDGLIAIGDSALFNNGVGIIPFSPEGTRNIAIGTHALKSNSNGSNNIAIGDQSQVATTYGTGNTSIGNGSMLTNEGGNGNTALGISSLYWNLSGGGNTGVGFNAIHSNQSGSNNTALGSNAYFTVSNLDNTTCIGFNAGGISNVSNRIEIGNTSVGWIGGQMGWATYSDARIKKNVQENVPGIAFIKKLRPVSYQLDIHTQNELTLRVKKEETDWPSKYDIEKKRISGLIAQEVAEAALAVGYDFSGVDKAEDDVGMHSLRYSSFVVPMIKAIQEQQEMIENQKTEIEILKDEIANLKKLIE
jgi:hypothetical protein